MPRGLTRTHGIGLPLLSALLTAVNPANGQMHHHESDSLGVVDFPVSCKSGTQQDFNFAMTLLHHMTYPQARAKFQSIVENDPGCAMAYWGIAMTLFQPVWPTRPTHRDLEQGWDAIEMARSLNPPTRREQLLIGATEAFFRDPGSTDYWKRMNAWKEGMERAYAEFPRDHEVSAFYALALVATVPPDQLTSPNNARAAEILLGILRENPRHPGAMHYLIHANDVPGREHESLEVLRAYAEVAPHNPHALHMPTHIYTRLGDWEKVISGNLQAAEAALEFPAGDRGQYVWDEFPHAIEYLIYAELQTGADADAAAQLERLQKTAGLEPTFKTAFHLSSTRARFALERQSWDEASAIVPREPAGVAWDRFPWPEAIGWFARGLGRVHTGDLVEARRAQQRIAELETVAAGQHEVLFARAIRVLRLDLTAWILDANGSPDSAVAAMTQAAELEASTPKHAVTPAPTLPAYELLGDLLSRHERYREALAAYQQSLKMNPNRFNSLLGAARAARNVDSVSTASMYYGQLLNLASPACRRPGIREAKTFLPHSLPASNGSTPGARRP